MFPHQAFPLLIYVAVVRCRTSAETKTDGKSLKSTLNLTKKIIKRYKNNSFLISDRNNCPWAKIGLWNQPCALCTSASQRRLTEVNFMVPLKAYHPNGITRLPSPRRTELFCLGGGLISKESRGSVRREITHNLHSPLHGPFFPSLPFPSERPALVRPSVHPQSRLICVRPTSSSAPKWWGTWVRNQPTIWRGGLGATSEAYNQMNSPH